MHIWLSQRVQLTSLPALTQFVTPLVVQDASHAVQVEPFSHSPIRHVGIHLSVDYGQLVQETLLDEHPQVLTALVIVEV